MEAGGNGMFRFRVISLVGLSVSIIFSFAGVEAAFIYVNGSCGDDAKSGHDPNCADPNGPKATIRSAIDAAAPNDTIIVADGTYTGPGNRDINFGGKIITLRSENGPANCVIDCQGQINQEHRAFYFNSGEGFDSVVDGFSIVNGYSSNFGGAIYCWGSSPTIKNCWFSHNTAEAGGALACRRNSRTRIIDCLIADNTAVSGGGIACQRTSPTIINGCMIINNQATNGGGIQCYDHSDAEISNSTIGGNTAQTGGGVICQNASDPTIRNTVLWGNQAQSGGGVGCKYTSNPKINNCTFNANQADVLGGGIHSFEDSNPLVSNGIFWNDYAPLGAEMALSVFWPGHTTSISVRYSDVKGGRTGVYLAPNCTVQWGWGNIDVDPEFAQQAYWDDNATPTDPNDDVLVGGDYHLRSQTGRWDPLYENWVNDLVTSRGIDAGNPGTSLGAEPVSAANIRINMGAYGGTTQASKTPTGWALRADLNNDGMVDSSDYAIQSGDWSKNAADQPGDLNRDGLIGLSDLALLVAEWLKETSWRI